MDNPWTVSDLRSFTSKICNPIFRLAKARPESQPPGVPISEVAKDEQLGAGAFSRGFFDDG